MEDNPKAKWNPYQKTIDIAYDEMKKMYKYMVNKYGKGVDWKDLSKNDTTLMRTVMDAHRQHCLFHYEYEMTGKMP